MDMQREIIAAIKRSVKVAPRSLWRFQAYSGFVIEITTNLSPEEAIKKKNEFCDYMEKWCEEGYFKAIQDGPVLNYMLTETGAKMIESEDTEF